MALSLSVLDLVPVGSGFSPAQALQNTLDLAPRAERLGYHRYWLAEHHNMPGIASSAPEILIGQVARATRHIRVGSGGIMLPNHAPLKVAEWFRTLEALFPGRIDLGIGRAPGTDPWTAMALRRSQKGSTPDDLPPLLTDLFAFSGGDVPAGHAARSITAVPAGVPLPPVWLLGSSDYSARLAARLGLGFVFAHHINPDLAVAAMALYREEFTPSAHLSEPQAMLTVSAVCAETWERADELATSLDLTWLRLHAGRPGPLPSPEEARAYPYTEEERLQVQFTRRRLVLGDPSSVKAQLEKLAKDMGAGEVIVTTMVYDHAARVRSYELLAEAFGLAGADEKAPGQATGGHAREPSQ